MGKPNHNANPAIVLVLLAIYLIALLKITIFRGSYSGVQSVSLVPFHTIAEYLMSVLSGNPIAGISNVLGNLVLFFPLGYLAALSLQTMRKTTRIFALTVSFSVAIEVFQYIFECGISDIDDVILNAIGGVMGYWIYVLATKFSKHKECTVLIGASMIAITCIGFFSFTNYRFLLPSPAPGNYPTHMERHTEAFREPLVLEEQPNTHRSPGAMPSAGFSPGATDDTAWYLILVNRWNHVPDDYEVDLTELGNGPLVDTRIYPALQEMFDAARGDGVYPVVVSGYRTAEKQQSLMDNKIAEYRALGYSAKDAIASAEAWVAPPGTSEHQLGIAVDINADGINSAGYEVYAWLEENAHNYGFICRYPADKTEITGVINEPWHYRYVGIEAAAESHDLGLCLEEYLNSTD